MSTTIYVMIEDDVVPVELYTTPSETDGSLAAGTSRSCEICQCQVAYAYQRDGQVSSKDFRPHTYCDMSGVAICLPCQLKQVASGCGASGIVTESIALTMIEDDHAGRHAA